MTYPVARSGRRDNGRGFQMLYEPPFFKFVYVGGKLRRGQVIHAPGEDEYPHAKLVPAPYRDALFDAVGGWVSVRRDSATASAWPSWPEMDPQMRVEVQAALQRWADANG